MMKSGKQRRGGSLAACVALSLALAAPASATEIIYRPVNPSFGGDPLNGSSLLNSANSQNRFKDPNAPGAAGFTQQTPVQQFSESLQRSILSRIAATISGQFVDASGKLIVGSSFENADFSIRVDQVAAGVVQVTIIDKATGQESSFQVSQ